MKTLFIVSESRVNDHEGEEYDYIEEVEHQPTTETIREWFDRVRTRIRSLWMEQVKPEGDSAEPDPDSKVVVYLDAAPPFITMLIDLQRVMGIDEGVVIDLPWREEVDDEASDPEARELIERLDREGDKENAEVQ